MCRFRCSHSTFQFHVQRQNRSSSFIVGGGQGGGRPGEKGAGGVREAGEEGAGSGIPKVAGSGRKRGKLRNIAQYFAIEKMQRGGSQKIQGGNRDYRVREAGGLNPPVPPPPTLYTHSLIASYAAVFRGDTKNGCVGD